MLEKKIHIKPSSGFTLIEVVIAVAIIAILSVVVTVSIMRNLDSGRIARAQSDCAAIAKTILQFRADCGFWPTRTNAAAAENVDNLITGGPADVPPGDNSVAPGANNWGRSGVVDTIQNQEIANTPAYAVSVNPKQQPGWNGPYLNSEALDPWGNSYMVNVRFLRANGPANRLQHNVFVLSAGPNGVTETAFDDGTVNEVITLGDDLGYQVR